MADPRLLLETSLESVLDAALTPAVFNTIATGAFDYVVFTVVGSDDTWYNMKKRGYVYEYEVVGINRDRATALGYANALDTAMAAAEDSLSLVGYTVIEIRRVAVVDERDTLPDSGRIFRCGGRYEIELEES